MKLLIPTDLVLTRIMVGDGRAYTNPALLNDLVSPIAQATSTPPVVNNNQLEFIVEYRNDLNGGLTTGFWLSEFGIFAQDPDVGEILLYYATLGDYPQWVRPFAAGSVDVRRYPISIGLSTDAIVILQFPAVAMLTADDLIAHNNSPTAHPDIRGDITDLRIKIENLVGIQITGVVDTYADLQAVSPMPPDGVLYLVRTDETHGGAAAVYEVIGGAWSFFALFQITIPQPYFDGTTLVLN